MNRFPAQYHRSQPGANRCPAAPVIVATVTTTDRDGHETAPRLIDVARDAGVSTGTVSRVLNGEESVAADLRERVLAAVVRLGYRPNPYARALRTGSTNTVAVSVRTLRTLSVPDFLTGLTSVLAPHGYTVVVTETAMRPEVEQSSVLELQLRRFHAVVALNPHSLEPFVECASVGVPALVVGAAAPPETPILGMPLREGRAMRALAERLVELRHQVVTQVIFGAEPETAIARTPHVREGRLGLRSISLGADGPSIWESLQLPPVDELLAGDTTCLLLRPDVAAPVLAMLRRSDVRIPRDVSVVLRGQAAWTELHDPPLDAIELDFVEVGRQAGAHVLAMLGADTEPDAMDFRYSYVPRDSVGAPPS